MENLFIKKKKDLENLGRKLMKKVYKFLHDEYILTFEEMKVEKDNIEKFLTKFYYKDNIEKYTKYAKFIIEGKNEDEICLKDIEAKIENESLDIDLIFEVLNLIKLHPEIDEDLYCEKKAFLYIYLVFTHYCSYL